MRRVIFGEVKSLSWDATAYPGAKLASEALFSKENTILFSLWTSLMPSGSSVFSLQLVKCHLVDSQSSADSGHYGFIWDSGSLCRTKASEKKKKQSDLLKDLKEGFWNLSRFQIWLICKGTWNQQRAGLDLFSPAICLQCVTLNNSLYFSEPYFPS